MTKPEVLFDVRLECQMELIGCYGDDLLVANAARVSFNKFVDRLEERDVRLIHYLANHKPPHFSPFTHPKASFRVAVPVFLARQWEKHRVGVTRGYDLVDQNEVSRRYVDDEIELFLPPAWRSRPTGGMKQGSGAALNDADQIDADVAYRSALQASARAYQELLRLGVAPEQARMVLPQSMMVTWIETGSLMYWARVYGLRNEAHAQREWEPMMAYLNRQMLALFPVSWPVLTNATEECSA